MPNHHSHQKTPPPPPDWDDFLAGCLDAFDSQLRSGQVPEVERIGLPEECPDAIQSEFKELQSCLGLLHRYTQDSQRSTQRDFHSESTRHSGNTADGLPESGEEGVPFQSDLFLGRFQLLRKLGEGTYGVVYLSRDPHLNRLVAIKVPRLDVAFHKDLRERLIREGEAAARLNHPNIVTIFEVITEGPASLIVSEYIEGPNLAEWLRTHAGRAPTSAECARFIVSVADGVAHAHARGVLHRDIKPSNIVLSNSGADDSLNHCHPKLTDFGLAKFLENQEATLSGALVGTPAYMSPEQIQGNRHVVGAQSDVYSLGVILLEMLTGRNPFSKETINSTIQAVTNPENVELFPKSTHVPRDLRIICETAIHCDLRKRYQGAMEFTGDLRRFLHKQPIVARPVTSLEKVWKWCCRYPALSSALFGVIVLLTLLLVSSYSANKSIQQSLKIVEESRREVRERAERLRRRVYAEDLQGAFSAMQAGNVSGAKDLLREYLPSPVETDLRSFPWWAMWNRIQQSGTFLGKHEGEATAVAVSPDGRFAATGGKDAVIRIWNLSQKSQDRLLTGHTLGPIQSLEFSRDGFFLLSAAEDGTFRIWDWKNSRCIINKAAEQGWLALARFTIDEKYILTAGNSGTIRKWNRGDGSPITEIKAHDREVRALALHPDNSLFVSAGQDDKIKIWNLKSLSPEKSVSDGELKNPTIDYMRALAFSPDGSQIAGGGKPGILVFWNLKGPSVGESFVRDLTLESPRGIRALLWMKSGELLATLTNRQLLIQSTLNGKLAGLEYFTFTDSEPMQVAVVPQSADLLSVERNGCVKIRSEADVFGQFRLPAAMPQQEYPTLQYEGKFLVTATRGNNTLAIFDTGTHKQIYRNNSLGLLNSPRCSPDGHLLIYVNKVGENLHDIVARDLLSDKELWRRRMDPTVTGSTILFAAGGNTLIVTDNYRILKLQARTGAILGQMNEDSSISSGRLCHSDRMLITGSAYGRLRYWSVELGTIIAESPESEWGHTIMDMDISYDQQELATVSGDQIKLWDLKLPLLKKTFRSPRQLARVNYVDNGKTLMVSGLTPAPEDDVQFIDVGEGRSVFRWHGVGRKDYAFDISGQQIALQGPQSIRIFHGASIK